MPVIRLDHAFPEPPGAYDEARDLYVDDDGTERKRGPLPKQAQFLQAALDTSKGSAKFIRYVGGVGCVPEDFPIETLDGPKPISELTPLDAVLTPDAPVQGILAFPRGRDYLYTVQHEHGEFVAAGSHLVFCADHTYRRVDELSSEHELLSIQPALQGIRHEASLAKSLQDVPHLYQRLADWLDHCLAYFHQYDQLPQSVLNTFQELLPRVADAPVFSQSSFLEDTARMGALLAQEPNSSRRDQLTSLLSKMRSALREADQTHAEADLALASTSVPALSATPEPELAPQTILSRLLERLNPNNYTYAEPCGTPSKVISTTKSDNIQTYWDCQVPCEAYYGKGLLHHNSGKSIIGCITILCMAIQGPGDYMIARQFLPELRATTYKTFLEICPPELIIEHRIADMEVHLRTMNGQKSIILFRGLDDWDKHRSLNLNAAYIDEANQVSEAAFQLLTGRLRGRHWRKLIMTQNSGGHDWSWRTFVKKDHIKDPSLHYLYLNISAPSTENVHLPPDYVATMLATWSEERVQREIYANEDSFEGQVYHEFRQDVHVIRPFRIPEHWTRVVGVDHGYRNPAAWVWGAVDGDGNIYIYREFYKREWMIPEIAQGKDGEKGVIELMRTPDGTYEKIDQVLIDPSVKATRGRNSLGSKGQKIESEWDEYIDKFPEWLHFVPANNEKQAGIDRVKQYLKVNPVTGRPSLFIFSQCTNLIDEIMNYRWAELSPSQQGKKNEREEPVKYNDHLLDAIRYMIMSRPELTPDNQDWYERNKIDYNSAQGALHRELSSLRSPKGHDPFIED